VGAKLSTTALAENKKNKFILFALAEADSEVNYLSLAKADLLICNIYHALKRRGNL